MTAMIPGGGGPVVSSPLPASSGWPPQKLGTRCTQVLRLPATRAWTARPGSPALPPAPVKGLAPARQGKIGVEAAGIEPASAIVVRPDLLAAFPLEAVQVPVYV